MKPPTYPARPMNGGRPDLARPMHGAHGREPKYNGWRGSVHIESGAMFNRMGQLLSIAHEFKAVLKELRGVLDAGAFKWADCEALERRHNIGRGSLIVLDVYPEPDFLAASYVERRDWLEAVLPIAPLSPSLWTPDMLVLPPCDLSPDAWKELQRLNKPDFNKPSIEFYEGVVEKRLSSIYPMQLRSPDEATLDWVKHRWEF